MTDWTPGGEAASDERAPALAAPGIVTKRPGVGPVILLVLAVAAAVFMVWVSPRVDDARADWNAAVPVLVLVTVDRGDSTMEVTEYGTDRGWIVERRQLDRIGATAIGSRVQARVAGECRCELLLQEPGSIPGYLLLAPLALGAVSLPGIISRRRWRRLGRVLAGPSRPAQLEPVWLRRPIGPPLWGARFAADRPGGTGPRSGGHVVVELAGTPAAWFPIDGSPVEVFGPDPDNGLVVFQAANGRAVASTAPRSGPSVERRTFAWSGPLALITGLVPPPAPGALDVGGVAHQRIRVGTGSDSGTDGSLELRPGQLDRSRFLFAVGVNAAWVGAYLVFEPTGPWLLVGLLAVALGVHLLRRQVGARLAARAPFASWEDRTAAREAAIAAAFLGYTQRPSGET